MVNAVTWLFKSHRSTLFVKCKFRYLPWLSKFFETFRSENRFVAGTKNGQVVIQSGVTIEKSVELFNHSNQEKNATLVQYTSNRIYAVAEDSSLTQLNMNLEVEKVLGRKIEKEILALVATQDYVALGGVAKKVTVYDEFGNLALVNQLP